MDIVAAKERFNRFFRDDLYGRYHSQSNIILSRGSWNDEYIEYPKLFSFCIDYALKKHWAGYSNSLGHDRTREALRRMLNAKVDPFLYTKENVALTLGNTVTIGVVFEALTAILPSLHLVTFYPYYTPLIKSIQSHVKNVDYVSSLGLEEDIIKELEFKIKTGVVNVLFLSNFVGVEGRVFSSEFWSEVIVLAEKNNIYVVIDEGVWFDPLPYPDSINSEKIIRISTISKKYAVPGCKIGFIVASASFIHTFYEFASTKYGGPLSVFFLMSEFLYQFEYIKLTGADSEKELTEFSVHYGITLKKLLSLYKNYHAVMKRNKSRFERNQRTFRNWVHENRDVIAEVYDFGGINVLFKPAIQVASYEFFLHLITHKKTSIFPSSCLGDNSDSMMRITLLELPTVFEQGLTQIADELHAKL